MQPLPERNILTKRKECQLPYYIHQTPYTPLSNEHGIQFKCNFLNFLWLCSSCCCSHLWLWLTMRVNKSEAANAERELIHLQRPATHCSTKCVLVSPSSASGRWFIYSARVWLRLKRKKWNKRANGNGNNDVETKISKVPSKIEAKKIRAERRRIWWSTKRRQEKMARNSVQQQQQHTHTQTVKTYLTFHIT